MHQDMLMPLPTDTCHDEVLQAARRLVEAFASNDTERYFAAFSPQATFVFHTTGEVLSDRATYRALWDSWQEDGLRVLACESREPRVSVLGNVAIFIHEVATRVSLAGTLSDSLERETIVFHRQPQGGWLAVHEHLSPRPVGQA